MKPWPRPSTAAVEQIQKIQEGRLPSWQPQFRPRWPMIVLNSPKGWTGPKVVDGVQIEGTFRAHQVPLSHPVDAPGTSQAFGETGSGASRPGRALRTEEGRLKPELAELAPTGERRMGANPHANGGILLRDLRMPDFDDYAIEMIPVSRRRRNRRTPTCIADAFLRDVTQAQRRAEVNFRVFGPDETLSNGLEAVFEQTKRQWKRRDCKLNDVNFPRALTGRVIGKCSASISAEWAGSKGICSPGGMGSSTATKLSFISLIRCSTSTPNG